MKYGTEAHKLRRNQDPETSHEAAELVYTPTLEERVHIAIARAGYKGATSDEVRAALPNIKSYSSVTARYKALAEKGCIRYSGYRRPGESGRSQRVMVADVPIIETPYDAGYDCSIHGPTDNNCHFKWFSTAAKSREWQQGISDGARDAARARGNENGT